MRADLSMAVIADGGRTMSDDIRETLARIEGHLRELLHWPVEKAITDPPSPDALRKTMDDAQGVLDGAVTRWHVLSDISHLQMHAANQALGEMVKAQKA